MKPNRITSPLLRSVLWVMCVVWTLCGWYVVATRSFSTRPRRVPVETTVEGWNALLMGGLLVALGLLSLLALLQGTGIGRIAKAVTVAAVLAVPAVFAVSYWSRQIL